MQDETENHMWHEERLYIDGELRGAERDSTYPNLNPATTETIGEAADATVGDVDDAIDAARRAFDLGEWSGDVALRVRCLRQLSAALDEHRAEIKALTIAEVGATAMACDTVQVDEPIRFVSYYADMAESYGWAESLGVADTLAGPAERWVEREPAGVVAAITPWNVPHQINLAKVAPALAAGCTVVLKPAPETPWCGLALGRLVAEHTEIPAGVFNVVTSSNKEIGERLVADPRVDMVSFTGSTATGRRVMSVASSNITRVFLELGGKSVHLVLDDVDDMASVSIPAVFGLATVAGQGCALSTRVLLPRSRYDEGVDALATMMASIPPGDPTDPSTMMGPLISEAQLERVDGYVSDGVAHGARVVCGGSRASDAGPGWFYQPTLLADLDNDMTVAREEIFGPVLVAIPYEDDDDAVRIANDSIYGLSGSVFSTDEERAVSVAGRIRTGTMSINGGVWYGCDVPFGGYKQSGIGREMGVAGFEEYLETKAYREAGDMNAVAMDGRRVLVVGASSGIGAAVARAVVDRGGRVCVSARRADRLESLCSELNNSVAAGREGSATDRAFAVAGDTTDANDARRVAHEAAELMGGLDLMVYVAGYGVLQRLEEIDAETWRGVFDVNVIGANLATSAAISQMVRDGVVAFVSSRTVEDASALFSSYSSTKAALDQCIRSWRVEHPDRRFVRVVMGNSQQPTEFHEHMGLELMAEAIDRWGAQALPSGMMAVDDVGAALVESLAVSLDHPEIDASELKFDARPTR